MRKVIAILLLVFPMLVSAQCVPDTSITHNDPGIYPDSATGLPHAIAGAPYSTVLQIKVFTDTVSFPLVFTVDSVVLETVIGLPPSFTYSCSPASCVFLGGGDGCVLLQGNPGPGDVGTYPLTVQTRAYGYLTGGIPTNFADNNDDYRIVIDPATGVASIGYSNFKVGQNIPNPAAALTRIPVTLSRAGNVVLSVSDLLGNKLFYKTYQLPPGKSFLSVDLDDLKPGIYLYTLADEDHTITRRMVLSKDR